MPTLPAAAIEQPTTPTLVTADPVAIPPSALPECGVVAPTGGWILRSFNATGTSVDTDWAVRVRNLRLGEPCLSGPSITIPGLLTEVPPAEEDQEWEDDGIVNPRGYLDWSACGGSRTINHSYADYIAGCGTTAPYNGAYPAGDYIRVKYEVVPSSSPEPYLTDQTVSFRVMRSFGSLAQGGMQATYWCYDPDLPVGNASSYDFYQTSGVNNITNGSGYVQTAWGGTGVDQFTNNTWYAKNISCPTGELVAQIMADGGASGPFPSNNGNRGWYMAGMPGGPTEPEPDAGPRLNGGVAASMTVGGGSTDIVVCTTDQMGGGQGIRPIVNAWTFNRNNPAPMNDPEDYASGGTVEMPILLEDSCDFIKEIYITVCVWVLPNGEDSFSCFQTIWIYFSFRDANPYPETTPEEDLCQYQLNPTGNCGAILYPDPNAPEASINCVIEYSDPANPITSIGEFFVGLPPWAACMFVPVGWDRNGSIQRTWTTGNIGKMQSAFQASVPGSIGCGPLASIPMWGDTVELNTCSVDIAPAMVKVVVGWVMVLGVCFLIIRRIMWSVGSK